LYMTKKKKQKIEKTKEKD